MTPLRHRQELHIGGSPVECDPMSSTPSLALAAQSKRKEKARIAARARRSQEANIILDMANELQITQDKIRRLDKATIVKLAIDYIKAFEILCRFRTIGPNLSSAPVSNIFCISNSSHNDINDNTSDDHQRHAIINITGNIKIENNHDKANITNCTSLNLPIPDGVVARESPQRAAIAPANIVNANTNTETTATNTTFSTTTTIINNNNNRSGSNKGISNKTSHEDENPPIPKFATGSIFAHKTEEVDSHFLVIKEQNGRAAFVLKPDTEIMDEDDLTHLAPQAGDSVSLEVEPLDEIVIDPSLFKICNCRR